MDSSIPHDFHDRGYKFLLSNLKLFQEVIEGFVELPWVSQLDFEKLEEAFSFVYNDRDSVIWRTIWVWFANWLRRNVGEEKAKQLLSHVDPNVIKGERAMNPPALIESLAKILEEREEEGILKGILKGREEGILKGRLIGQIQLSEKVLRRPVTPESELQRLETDAMQRLAEALEKEIDARNG